MRRFTRHGVALDGLGRSSFEQPADEGERVPAIIASECGTEIDFERTSEPRRGFTGRVDLLDHDLGFATLVIDMPFGEHDGTGLHQFGVREIGLGEQDAFDACNPITRA